MAYVITSLCSSTCDTACARVCPVDAIHGALPLEAMAARARAGRPPGPSLQLYIDPETCICCGACEPECPVEAIFEEGALPTAHVGARELNAAFFAPR